MKRLLVILALLLSPALHGQGYVNPYANATQTGNLVPDWSFDGPVNSIPQGWTSSMPPGMGGSIQPGCGGLSNQGQCFVFSYAGTTLSTVIDLSQYETNSFEFYFDFFYRMNCNNSIGGYCGNPNGPKDLFGASVQFFTTNGEAGYFNFIPIAPDYFKAGDPGVNQLNYKEVGWYSSQESQYLFTSAIISFYGQDTGFWAGPYGPALDRVSFRIGYLPPPEPTNIAVDCTLFPNDPTCVIAVYTDPNTIANNLVDSITTASSTTTDTTPTTSTTDNNTTIVAEIVPTSTTTTDPTFEKQTTTENTTTPVATVDTVLPAALDPVNNEKNYRELSDEEKAAILADAISKSAIESALSIAATNTANGVTSGTVDNSTSSTKTNDKTNTDTVDTSMVAQGQQQNNTTDSTDTANDILDTGRNAGQQQLASILQSSADTADVAAQQAEQIAQTSYSSSQIDIINKDTGQIDLSSLNIPDFSQDTQTVEQNVMDNMNNVVDNSLNEFGFILDDGKPKDPPGYVNSSDIEVETLALLESIKASSEAGLDDSKQFEDTVLSNNIDPNNPALNLQQNVMNLEILGVIKPAVEEKSDAEKAAEKVIAANQEQMEEINKNYMDADQSGIVAAMGADADVSSYRNARLADATLWYKPEDIYKNVSYKDNVRGMYFLEKGNTDTYKQMVEEQYK